MSGALWFSTVVITTMVSFVVVLIALAVTDGFDRRAGIIGAVVVVALMIHVGLLDEARKERDSCAAQLVATRHELAELRNRAVAAGMGGYVEKVVGVKKEFVFFDEIATGSAEVGQP